MIVIVKYVYIAYKYVYSSRIGLANTISSNRYGLFVHSDIITAACIATWINMTRKN